MIPGPTLQVTGGVCELGGILAVAIGIGQTREKFSNRPSLARRAWARIVRVAAMLRRRPPQLVIGVAAGTATGTVSARGRATIGFGNWDQQELAERIKVLRRAFENQDRFLDEIDGRVNREEITRREADDRHDQVIEHVRRELTDLIREAAAGGLRLETIGVCFFALGVVLGTLATLA